MPSEKTRQGFLQNSHGIAGCPKQIVYVEDPKAADSSAGDYIGRNSIKRVGDKAISFIKGPSKKKQNKVMV